MRLDGMPGRLPLWNAVAQDRMTFSRLRILNFTGTE